MKTIYREIDPLCMDEMVIAQAAKALQNGKLVAFPTETVYGLGADAMNPTAVKSIYEAKGRPGDNPLIVHIADRAQLSEFVREVPDSARMLMDRFWGGPLTIIMKKQKNVPDEVTAGLDTVAIRLPSHPVAHALLKCSGLGIAAPSANISGRPSPTVAKHVRMDLDDRIDYILDGGASKYGVESTVIDMSGERPLILRPGAVSLEEIREILPDAAYGGGGEGVPKSPGMKYTHYSPKADVVMVRFSDCEQLNALAREEGKNIGILALQADKRPFRADVVLTAGEDSSDYAARLFYLLREFDALGVDVIYAQAPEASGIGAAVYNRLLKAAGGKLIEV